MVTLREANVAPSAPVNTVKVKQPHDRPGQALRVPVD